MKISEVIVKLMKMWGRYGDIDTCIENVLDNTIGDQANRSAVTKEGTLIFYDTEAAYEAGEGDA